MEKAKAMRVEMLPIHKIQILERIRRENGSLDELAQDIQEHGLLNPITVMEQADGGYVLIAGLRRLKASEQIGESDIRATVMSPMEADEMLRLEISENEQRKDFTTSERLAFAERIQAVEKEKGKHRMFSGKSQNNPMRNCPQGAEKGSVRDIVAEKAGFSSSRQLRRAQELANARPDLIAAVDKGEKTIGGAYRQMQEEAEVPRSKVGGLPSGCASKDDLGEDALIINRDGLICEKQVDIPFYEPYRPGMEPAPGNVRTLKGADHEHLLENPIYSRLYNSYNDAVQQVNLARGELRTRCEGYERRIRGYAENVQAMQQEIARLREALHA